MNHSDMINLIMVRAATTVDVRRSRRVDAETLGDSRVTASKCRDAMTAEKHRGSGTATAQGGGNLPERTPVMERTASVLLTSTACLFLAVTACMSGHEEEQTPSQSAGHESVSEGPAPAGGLLASESASASEASAEARPDDKLVAEAKTDTMYPGMDGLLGSLGSKDPEVVVRTIRTLAHIGNPSTLVAMERVLRDPSDPGVKSALAAARETLILSQRMAPAATNAARPQ